MHCFNALILSFSILVAAFAVFYTTDYFKIHREFLENEINRLLLKSEKMISVKIPDDLSTTKEDSLKSLKKKSKRLFTKTELAEYVGGPNSPGLHLSILGKVYDVSRGKKNYGPGGGYHFFAGKDGSRAFATGQFNEEGLIEDVSGLQSSDYTALRDWALFYKKDYIYKGKLIGLFYDENGKSTRALKQYRLRVKEGEVVEKEIADDNRRFPACNSEWAQNQGGRIWCTRKSGGIERKWIGYPRRYFRPGASSYRCACVNEDDLNNPVFQPYPNCDPVDTSCPLPDDS